jgi:hypothetical protein
VNLRRSLVLLAAALTLLAAEARAAGTVTVTEETFGTVKKITFAWTSTAGGAADAPTVATFSGKIEALVTIPDAVDAPTTLYDVTVTDADGVDVLAGAGANRSATATELVLASLLGIVANDLLTVNITNAGAAKKGRVIVYSR